ncbi:MAG: pyridoxal phosphate-dependent aminotransferase [Candidatus Altiarchaeales archaeon]|nr:pyridoxal phosphate-dependent aminotransferase [Candidatus Altiarchaeota archaeon]MBU4341848.1 pyridoxal phosphate-dependent aminotransferase [Candidatus Altiarchaeota archaeon]MBU4406282.1 pyridoxal phosphate-dependent aminotransferase [Candidatus Altiarchaeota archaeon]MBU4437712.1 pyridoxal phosphate-dependent aminotransferase [Candidatus Altiarchaeota archaeon]MCG2782294.1 pyridoxal phosphate-dependent aminotransferase [Candidatus Altiarchaeales archaeon]
MEFATRLSNVEESATFKYSSLAKKEGIINLTIGRTNFTTPRLITRAAVSALENGRVHYTPTRGIPELREMLAKKLKRENNIPDIGPDNILVSAGAKQIIFEAVMALIGKGDKVAMPNPSWVSYEQIVNLAEGEIIWLPLKHENDFIPDEEFLSALENSSPKLIMLNSPNNPTGAVYPEKIIREIVDIAERKDCWLLFDEIYEKIIYEGKHFSAGSIYPKTITVNGFSKEFSMTGWRLGYCACPNPDLIEKMNLIQSQTVSCATSFVQYGALAAFKEEVAEERDRMITELKERRDRFVKGMNGLFETKVNPAGAFYLFPHLGDIDDLAMADKLLSNGVGLIPGSPFGSQGKGCLRISYGAVSLDEIDVALERIKATLA